MENLEREILTEATVDVLILRAQVTALYKLLGDDQKQEYKAIYKSELSNRFKALEEKWGIIIPNKEELMAKVDGGGKGQEA